MPKLPDQMQSRPLKVPVKQALIDVNRIIARGQAAVTSSQASLSASPNSVQAKADHRVNEELLAKAEYIKAGLEMSEKLADFMCPQQVAVLDFDFVD